LRNKNELIFCTVPIDDANDEARKKFSGERLGVFSMADKTRWKGVGEPDNNCKKNTFMLKSI
jgi:hypothetical protein